MFSRFEKIARHSVAQGVVDGMFDLRRDLREEREDALSRVPREARTRIRSAINGVLTSAGVTRATVQRNLRELRMLRGERPTLIKIAGKL